MGILETLIIIFLAIFLGGLILSAAIWLIWVALVIAVVFIALKFIIRFTRRLTSPKK